MKKGKEQAAIKRHNRATNRQERAGDGKRRKEREATFGGRGRQELNNLSPLARKRQEPARHVEGATSATSATSVYVLEHGILLLPCSWPFFFFLPFPRALCSCVSFILDMLMQQCIHLIRLATEPFDNSAHGIYTVREDNYF